MENVGKCNGFQFTKDFTWSLLNSQRHNITWGWTLAKWTNLCSMCFNTTSQKILCEMNLAENLSKPVSRSLILLPIASQLALLIVLPDKLQFLLMQTKQTKTLPPPQTLGNEPLSVLDFPCIATWHLLLTSCSLTACHLLLFPLGFKLPAGHFFISRMSHSWTCLTGLAAPS